MTLTMSRLISIRCAEHAAAALVIRVSRLAQAVAMLSCRRVGSADAAPMPVPPASAAPKDDGQWRMAAKNYAATRFSELDQINGGNVANLRIEFTFSTGVNKGEEAAPLIVNNTMYVVTPYPNFLFALDLTKPGAPLKWEYQPQPAGEPRRRLLRRGQSRRRILGGQDHLQHARRLHRRGRSRERQGGVEDQARRHQPGRDHHDGAAGRKGESAGRRFRRRVRRARLDRGARRRGPASSPGRPFTPDRTRTC